MMLIDTSIIVQLLRDGSGVASKNWRRLVARADFVLPRIAQLEVLQGARDETEWAQLEVYMGGQDYVEIHGAHWSAAARIHFDLRRKGITVRSILDCCVAQVAIAHKLTLIHLDRDYEAIAKARPLRHRRVDLLA